MAFDEYIDLYLLAQNNPNAFYHVISFDVVNSRLIHLNERQILQENLMIIAKNVYNKLFEKEKQLNKQIVIKDERFIRPWNLKSSNKVGYYIDPIIFGDCLQFTVLRGSITKEEIIDLFYECKKELNMNEEFHISDGYYETNEYDEGTTTLFRGYCLSILGNIHKSHIQEKLKLINKS